MKKRLAVILAAASLSVGLLPGAASAGQYCERADDVGLGGVCREVGGIVVKACDKAKVDCTLG